MENHKIITKQGLQVKSYKRGVSTTLILAIALIFLAVIFSLFSRDFYSIQNVTAMLTNISFLGITAVGFTINLISGEMDISIGANIALTSCVVAVTYSKSMPIYGSIILGLLVGAVLGTVNGLIVTTFNINSLIVTLGTMSIAQGIAFTITKGETILIMENVLGYFGRGKIGSVPFPIIFVILITILFALILNITKYGRYIQAVGSNSKVAFMSGINIKKTKFMGFLICAIMASISGLLITSTSAVGMPLHGIGQEFPIISAVILGGTSLAGGSGSIIGSILGILIIGVIYNGLTMLNVSSFIVEMIRGLLLIVIVAAYEIQKRKQF